MKKLTIHIDMDGIVADCHQKWIERINKKLKKKFTVADIKDWDIGSLDPSNAGKIYQMIQKPMFFYDLEPLPGSQNAVKALQDMGHDVNFLTSPASPHSAMEKLLWIEKHFPFVNHKNVILTHQKHLVNGDVFIDDKGAGVEEYQKHHPNALVLTIGYPFNEYLRNHKTIKTIGQWDNTAEAWFNAVEEIERKAKS
jgi:5'-nucleotidase